MRNARLLIFNLIFALSAVVARANYVGTEAPKPLSSLDNVIDYYLNGPLAKQERLTQESVKKFVPMDLAPTNNGSQVLMKVADQSLNTFVNDPQVKNSFLGRTANHVQESMQTDVSIKPTSENGVEHKFRFMYLAFQSTAKMDYSGYLNASIRFSTADSSMNMEVFEKLSGNRDLVLSRERTLADDVNKISLRWNF